MWKNDTRIALPNRSVLSIFLERPSYLMGATLIGFVLVACFGCSEDGMSDTAPVFSRDEAGEPVLERFARVAR